MAKRWTNVCPKCHHRKWIGKPCDSCGCPELNPPWGNSKGPMRKVVKEQVSEYENIHESLECGHTITQPSDIFGPTNAYRRRCFKCSKEWAEEQLSILERGTS